jgi:hypothetical protein
VRCGVGGVVCWRGRGADPSSRYIIVSFTDATLVLSVGETVEEATDSGLERKFPTLACALLEDDVILQVHTAGVRQVRGVGADRRVSEWPAPGRKTIVKACCNSRQCVVALTGGELMYFELDETVSWCWVCAPSVLHVTCVGVWVCGCVVEAGDPIGRQGS